jgi:Protein of unknown function (DUF2793)
MSDTSPILGLPYIAGSQASPEITHNTALNMLQALLTGVISVGTTAPPGSPSEGDAYVIGASATGAWAGEDHKITAYIGGQWAFVPGVDDSGSSIAMGADQEGLRVYDKTTNSEWVWSGALWNETPDLANYAKASLPPATGPTRLIYVTDDVGGAVPAFNDGANWRRVTDRNVIS